MSIKQRLYLLKVCWRASRLTSINFFKRLQITIKLFKYSNKYKPEIS
jgi:hypothetical protein